MLTKTMGFPQEVKRVRPQEDREGGFEGAGPNSTGPIAGQVLELYTWSLQCNYSGGYPIKRRGRKIFNHKGHQGYSGY